MTDRAICKANSCNFAFTASDRKWSWPPYTGSSLFLGRWPAFLNDIDILTIQLYSTI